MTKLVTSVIDFFHPPFRKLMPLQTFRYAACGGGNTMFDIVLYYISYNFVLKKKDIYLPFEPVDLYFFTLGSMIRAHIGALVIASTLSFFTGFWLNKNIVFVNSSLPGKAQMFRYLLLVLVCFLINYLCMNLFVDRFHIYPTISKIITTVIVVSFSYLTQKKFTFKQ